MIDPPRRKFGGRSNGGKRTSELVPSNLGNEIFLAYGTITRRYQNMDHTSNSTNGGVIEPTDMNGNNKKDNFVPRGKSSKLLLDENDRSSKYYEVVIFAPAFLKPMLHEKCILGWASPNGVILSADDKDSILGSNLSPNLRAKDSIIGLRLRANGGGVSYGEEDQEDELEMSRDVEQGRSRYVVAHNSGSSQEVGA